MYTHTRAHTHTHTHTYTYTHTYIYIHIYIYTAGLSLLGDNGTIPPPLKIYQNHRSRSNLPPSLPIQNLVQKFKENLPRSLKKLVLSYRNLFIGNILTPVWKGHHTDMNSIGHQDIVTVTMVCKNSIYFQHVGAQTVREDILLATRGPSTTCCYPDTCLSCSSEIRPETFYLYQQL